MARKCAASFLPPLIGFLDYERSKAVFRYGRQGRARQPTAVSVRRTSRRVVEPTARFQAAFRERQREDREHRSGKYAASSAPHHGEFETRATPHGFCSARPSCGTCWNVCECWAKAAKMSEKRRVGERRVATIIFQFSDRRTTHFCCIGSSNNEAASSSHYEAATNDQQSSTSSSGCGERDEARDNAPPTLGVPKPTPRCCTKRLPVSTRGDESRLQAASPLRCRQQGAHGAAEGGSRVFAVARSLTAVNDAIDRRERCSTCSSSGVQADYQIQKYCELRLFSTSGARCGGGRNVEAKSKLVDVDCVAQRALTAAAKFGVRKSTERAWRLPIELEAKCALDRWNEGGERNAGLVDAALLTLLSMYAEAVHVHRGRTRRIGERVELRVADLVVAAVGDIFGRETRVGVVTEESACGRHRSGTQQNCCQRQQRRRRRPRHEPKLRDSQVAAAAKVRAIDVKKRAQIGERRRHATPPLCGPRLAMMQIMAGVAAFVAVGGATRRVQDVCSRAAALLQQSQRPVAKRRAKKRGGQVGQVAYRRLHRAAPTAFAPAAVGEFWRPLAQRTFVYLCRGPILMAFARRDDARPQRGGRERASSLTPCRWLAALNIRCRTRRTYWRLVLVDCWGVKCPLFTI